MRFCNLLNAGSQYLAVGDSQGDLHILDIPRNLRKRLANEVDLMSNFYSREVNRINYYRNKVNVSQANSSSATNNEDDKKLESFVFDEKAELEYQKLLAKFKSDLGIVN